MNEELGLDLVDEMQWEDCGKVEFISLEEAGLEEADGPMFGFDGNEGAAGGVQEYLLWVNDGEDSRYESN